MANKIFISYRRDDSAGTAGRLHDRLAERFGQDNLFIDVDNLPAGADFVEYLGKQIANCEIFLCTVGPNWLNAKDDDGRRRLDQPDDYVRVEIAEALKRTIPVIPVLIDGARLPKRAELPEDIASLTRRQAVEVRNSNFRRDADDLTQKINGILKEKRTALSAAVLAAIVGAIAFLVFGSIGIYQAGMISLPWLHSGPAAPTAKPDKEMVSTSGPIVVGLPPNTLPPEPDASSAKQAGATDASDAAKLASASAMTNTGLLYDVGKGVPQDYAEARRWYEKAAAMGEPNAMTNIGLIYAQGKGVPQDYAEARRWFGKAAAAGDATAKDSLARLPAK
jgi:TIR domain/Sel1 repeat